MMYGWVITYYIVSNKYTAYNGVGDDTEAVQLPISFLYPLHTMPLGEKIFQICLKS